MRVAARCTGAIRRVGATAYLLREGEKLPFTASVQPLFQAGERDGIPMGFAMPGRFEMYICWEESSREIRADDSILWQGALYVVVRIETVFYGGEGVYRWAALAAGSPGERQEN